MDIGVAVYVDMDMDVGVDMHVDVNADAYGDMDMDTSMDVVVDVDVYMNGDYNTEVVVRTCVFMCALFFFLLLNECVIIVLYMLI